MSTDDFLGLPPWRNRDFGTIADLERLPMV
jgi:hypothetical protein